MEVQKTALYNLHKSLGAKFVPFAGYEMPIQYKDGIVKEHISTRSYAGFFDVSHMGQFFLEGDDTLTEALEKIIPADLDSLKLNQSKYSFLYLMLIMIYSYSIFNEATKSAAIVFFAPVVGTLTDGYNPKTKHFAVDIVVPKDTPIKATADGVVIFAEWTVETGYVVIIEHNQELISVYKHNSAITKSQGDLVKAGEVIAMSGNTGELSTGPHLHFELWSKGYPVNPTNFIQFQ